MINIKTLSNTDNSEILDCFNLSFSDYSIPFKLNIQQLEMKIMMEDINKEISVGAFRENTMIGFVLHGNRIVDSQKSAYNAGTGVIPNERGHALTYRMYEFILPILKNKEFDEIILEVISNNEPAIKSYNRIGFVANRNLDCFKGELRINEINKEIKINEDSNPNLEILEKFGQIRPTWQNSIKSIHNLGKSARTIVAHFENKIVGYCTLNLTNDRILQIAVNEKYRNMKIGKTLLRYIQSDISKNTSIINIDSSSEITTKFFSKNNFTKLLTQVEMKLRIAST